MENISSNASIILLAAAFICMPVTAATQYGRELKRFTADAHVKGSGNLFQIGRVYRAANSFREKDKSDNNEDMNKGGNENQNNEAIHRIIDISEYQNGADLEAAYRDGISGFILRIGCGNDDVCQDDRENRSSVGSLHIQLCDMRRGCSIRDIPCYKGNWR